MRLATGQDEELRREFLDPANKYKAQYRELEERMRERKRRHEEVDKLQDQVKKYKEKNDARLSAVCTHPNITISILYVMSDRKEA